MCILFRVLFGLPVRTPFDISIRFPFRLPFGCVPSRFPFRLTFGRQTFEVKAASRSRRPGIIYVFERRCQFKSAVVSCPFSSLFWYPFSYPFSSFRLPVCFPFGIPFGLPFRSPVRFHVRLLFSANKALRSKRPGAHAGPTNMF